jgi:hypothetical protein
VPATGVVCPGAVASVGAGAVAGRDGGVATPRTSASWSSRAAAAARACWASASIVVTRA